MKKLIAILALALTVVAVNADNEVLWHFYNYDDENVTIPGGTDGIDFPMHITGLDTIEAIEADEYYHQAGLAWVVGGPYNVDDDLMLQFTIYGLPDSVMEALDASLHIDHARLNPPLNIDLFDLTKNDHVTVKVWDVDRDGHLFTAYFNPAAYLDEKGLPKSINHVDGIHWISLTGFLGPDDAGYDDYYEDVRIDMIGVRPIGSDPIDPDDPDPDHDDGLLVPEPATYAYALMGLGSVMGLKRRIKK